MKHLSGASLEGRLLALLATKKGLPGSNTLAYCENYYITAVKSFITSTPGANVINLFMAVSYEFL